MTRWRRPGAGEILQVYLLLAAVGFILTWVSGRAGSQDLLLAFLITAFLTWRVSRGGRISRMILLVFCAAYYAVNTLNVARSWDLTIVALVAVDAAQVALLMSPPVYGRTRRPRAVQARAPGWARLVSRPPMWLLP